MYTLTMSTKGQVTLPKELRDRLRIEPGSRLQADLDAHGRLVLTVGLHDPASLFLNRPAVARTLTIEDMDEAIGAALGRG
jgi:antitoxin PrlF